MERLLHFIELIKRLENEKPFLVEIALKNWVVSNNRIVSFEEVLADDEYSAKHCAFEQFEKRIKYEPIARRTFQKLNLKISDIFASDAVELDK